MEGSGVMGSYIKFEEWVNDAVITDTESRSQSPWGMPNPVLSLSGN